MQPLLQHRRGLDHHHGVAVRHGLGDGIEADDTAGAGPVLDHPRLLEPLRELGGEDAADGVDPAAGRDRHDEGNRAGVAGGCLCGGTDRGRDGKSEPQDRQLMGDPH